MGRAVFFISRARRARSAAIPPPSSERTGATQETAEPQASRDANRTDRFPIYDLETFLRLENPPRQWLAEGLIAERGLAMVYAKRGVGKTHFVLGLACAIAALPALPGARPRRHSARRRRDARPRPPGAPPAERQRRRQPEGTFETPLRRSRGDPTRSPARWSPPLPVPSPPKTTARLALRRRGPDRAGAASTS